MIGAVQCLFRQAETALLQRQFIGGMQRSEEIIPERKPGTVVAVAELPFPVVMHLMLIGTHENAFQAFGIPERNVRVPHAQR